MNRVELIWKFKALLLKAISVVMAISLFVMTVLVVLQVFTRYVTNNPLVFTEELLRFMLIWSSMLSAAYCFALRAHLSLTFFEEFLLKRNFVKLISYLRSVSSLIVLIFLALIMIYGGIQASIGGMLQISPILKVPVGYVYTSLVVSGGFSFLSEIINIIENFVLSDEELNKQNLQDV